MAKLHVELIPDDENGGFTACIPDIPAYGEGETEEAAIADLKEALILHIEEIGLEETVALIRQPHMRELDWDLAELARGQASAPDRQDADPIPGKPGIRAGPRPRLSPHDAPGEALHGCPGSR
jgi:predicted RNase H-like HicB family nuclease